MPSRRTVLIVEDNQDGRDSLRVLLEMWGYDVEVAEDGIRGIQQALRLSPQVVVADIGLPGLDGYQVARQIRSALGASVFLIALTGYSDVEQALRAGFDVHFTKPADLAQLARVLRDCAA